MLRPEQVNIGTVNLIPFPKHQSLPRGQFPGVLIALVTLIPPLSRSCRVARGLKVIAHIVDVVDSSRDPSRGGCAVLWNRMAEDVVAGAQWYSGDSAAAWRAKTLGANFEDRTTPFPRPSLFLHPSDKSTAHLKTITASHANIFTASLIHSCIES